MYGNVPGVDSAFYRHGQVYHTHRDAVDMQQSSEGSMQQMGENSLTYIRSVASMDEKDIIPDYDDDSKAVYLDVYSLFTLYYTSDQALIYNSITLIIGAVVLGLYMFWNCWKNVLRALLCLTMAVIGAILVPMIQGYVLHVSGFRMSWYSFFLLPWLVFLPAVILGGVFGVCIFKKRFVEKIIEADFFAASLLSWIMILLMCTILKIGSGIYALIFTVCFSLAIIIELFMHKCLGRGAAASNEHIGDRYQSMDRPKTSKLYESDSLLSSDHDVEMGTTEDESIRGKPAIDEEKLNMFGLTETYDKPLVDKPLRVAIKPVHMASMLSYIGIIPATALGIDLSVSFVEAFAAMMGRFGEVPADVIVAGLVTIFFTASAINIIAPSAFFTSSIKKFMIGAVIAVLTVTFCIGGFIPPYGVDAPKRVQLQQMYYHDLGHTGPAPPKDWSLKRASGENCFVGGSSDAIPVYSDIYEDFENSGNLSEHCEDPVYVSVPSQGPVNKSKRWAKKITAEDIEPATPKIDVTTEMVDDDEVKATVTIEVPLDADDDSHPFAISFQLNGELKKYSFLPEITKTFKTESYYEVGLVFANKRKMTFDFTFECDEDDANEGFCGAFVRYIVFNSIHESDKYDKLRKMSKSVDDWVTVAGTIVQVIDQSVTHQL
eukprot:TRINITY_DN1194_c0_g1_i2.p1 TRINITY_DN1194_c0_g1~~TRINITY_DN1194_c0_g1_i2.p1  ORF type:complete len:659 (-),score=229.53 TRINITY_DN1194_c0_g1_i2:286-2262(-)